MEKQMQAMDDKQAEVVHQKKPYETPTLTKLGSVEQVTQGQPRVPVPDPGTVSV